MKATLSEVIKAIQPGAVGSFNVLDLDMAMAVIDCAEELAIPAIVGVATRHYKDVRTSLLAPSLVKAMEQSSQPVALHLDHAAPDELDIIKQALDLGFTSIMIDGSRLPFEENVAVTAKVVEMAKAYGAGVEGELGAVAGEEGVADTDSDAPESLPYTQADEAVKFIEQTGIDALAIAVGTAHGIYTEEPHIHFDTITNIATVTDTPLVMHGATGVSDEAIRQSVTGGIRKINFFSGLLQSAMDEVRNSGNTSNNDFLAFKGRVAESWRSVISHQMKLYANR